MDDLINHSTLAPFTVLIAVYARENPDYLEQSLASIWDKQSLKPNEIVLVKDGPLTPELDQVIIAFCKKAPIKIVTLVKNQGLGTALRTGLEFCSHDLVARMDSDDIARSDRFMLQVTLMCQNPSIGVAGSNIAEFETTPEDIVSYRVLPAENQVIRKFARRRNPMNHMSVIFRKKIILDAGNYIPHHGYEDYYLWARIIAHNIEMRNIQENLIFARISGMLNKRRGVEIFKTELSLQFKFLQMRFISPFIFLSNIFLRALPRLLPLDALRLIYTHLRNKKVFLYFVLNFNL